MANKKGSKSAKPAVKKKNTTTESALKLILKSIKRKYPEQPVSLDSLSIVIDDKNSDNPELMAPNERRIGRRWVCRFRNGRFVCAWE